VHFVYIDDSGDEKVRAFCGLAIPSASWKSSVDAIRQFRRELKKSRGIYVTVEFHATDFVGGRGRIVPAPAIVPKAARCAIFQETLKMIASLPGARLFNAIGARTNEKLLFERLMTRINNTMRTWKSAALILHDEGKDYTSLVRKMCVYNPIKSRYGGWDDGKLYKNFPLVRILEDIVFRKSEDSVFIQMADFSAFALLRSEYPLASKNKYGVDKAFSKLHSICIKECFGADPKKLGIIRDT
jgi:hypothetical protein